MPYNDDELGTIFPTRTGEATGAAQERKMLDKIHDTTGFRTGYRINPDGGHTILRTRGNNPEFITSKVEPPKPTFERGFVAHAKGDTAMLFNPYTLASVDEKYKLFNHTYTVMLYYSTTYNVSPTDTTEWNDTLSFKDSSLLVNGKAVTTDAPVFQNKVIPWYVSDTTPTTYTAEQLESSTFFIGRFSAHAFSGDGYVMPQSEAREQGRVIDSGPSIFGSRATLYQLQYNGYAWDALGSAWVMVVADVVMSKSPLGVTGDSLTHALEFYPPPPTLLQEVTGTSEASTQLPSVDVCLIGRGATSSGESDTWVQWPRVGVFRAAPDGYIQSNYLGTVYDLKYSGGLSFGADGCSYEAKSTVTYTHGTKTTGISAQRLNMPPNGVEQTPAATIISATNTSETGRFIWDGGGGAEAPPPNPPGVRGIEYIDFDKQVIGSAEYTQTQQDSTVSISVNNEDIFSGDIHRLFTDGSKCNPAAKDTWAAALLAVPYGWCIPGDTTYWLEMFADNPANTLAQNYERGGELDAMMADGASRWAQQVRYGNAISDVDILYTSSVDASAPDDTRWMTLRTKDYILYDKVNGAYVYIEGELSGTQRMGEVGTADLSVKLVISAGNFVTVKKAIFDVELEYFDMLPTAPVGDLGVRHIPMPAMRVMFAPLHRDQGSFEGAAYVTEIEQLNGAGAAALFNFVLKLDTYNEIGAEPSDDGVVRFIPCCLLELLYGYVYSNAFGMDEYERYPIRDIARYKHFNETLFSDKINVSCRNGVFVDWLDIFGDPYLSESKTELFRV